ncbi:rho-related GTP-binding protein RhoV-like isoform X2 [Cynoglossus semilaevis]|uniref:rho-related GTP-binding protein RhoV-like isoform X2 n=1 Tax=Cynoglossus semilaevis TaxID=244447 RepID=UPI0007DCA914|nr:rho-related GTP-binding protein RhoV-like isoform X2 [Cynoglossus semilaevis]
MLGGNMAQAGQRRDKPTRQREEVSIMLVGDRAVGKSSLIISYVFNGYNSQCRPTVFDVFTGLVHVNGVPTRIKLIDTAGQDFDHLRSLCYAHVDVFILCFSLVDPVSFDNITSKWIPQIRAGNQRSPIVLVGTQSDLRHSVDVLIHLHQWNTKPVHFRKARRMAQRIRACDYVECSALTQHNLKDVFDSAVWAAIKHKKSTTGCKKLNLYKQLRDICTHGLKKIFKYI